MSNAPLMTNTKKFPLKEKYHYGYKYQNLNKKCFPQRPVTTSKRQSVHTGSKQKHKMLKDCLTALIQSVVNWIIRSLIYQVR